MPADWARRLIQGQRVVGVETDPLAATGMTIDDLAQGDLAQGFMRRVTKFKSSDPRMIHPRTARAGKVSSSQKDIAEKPPVSINRPIVHSNRPMIFSIRSIWRFIQPIVPLR